MADLKSLNIDGVTNNIFFPTLVHSSYTDNTGTSVAGPSYSAAKGVYMVMVQGFFTVNSNTNPCRGFIKLNVNGTAEKSMRIGNQSNYEQFELTMTAPVVLTSAGTISATAECTISKRIPVYMQVVRLSPL